MVDGQSLQGISKNINAPDEMLNIDSTLNLYIKNTQRQYNNSHTLKEVQIIDKAVVKTKSAKDFPELTGLSFADHDINAERFTGCSNFLSCLQVFLTGVTYRENNFYITRDFNAGKKTPMAIFYNGLNVDYAYLTNVNSTDIQSVEIFLNDGVSGINNRYQTSGVIEINSKIMPKGTKISADQLRDLFPPKYEATLTPKGFNMGREFYSPKYIAPPSVTQRADLRSTIYWNPHLTTDKLTGAVAFDFYNSDAKGTYKAVVEGMDAEGNIGRYVYRFKVQ